MTSVHPTTDPATGGRIAFEQTVPRKLTHRWAVSEVYVTDAAQLGTEEFLAGVQVPRAHCVWYDRRFPFHDPLAVVEAGRQAAFVVVHRYFGVPVEGYSFVSQQIDYRVVDLERFRDDGRSPLEGVFHLVLSDQEERDGDLVGVTFRAELTVGGRPAMTMGGRLVFFPRADYEVMRVYGRARGTEHAAEPPVPAQQLDPALVGRVDRRNVVLADIPQHSPGQHRFGLVVDPSHPSFFDHPQDHVPGPLIVEALRQAAIVAAQRDGVVASPVAVLGAGDAEFLGFAELDALTVCSASVKATSATGHVTVCLTLDQFGKQLASATVELFPCPSSER